MRINKKKNALLIAELLEKHYPDAKCSLECGNNPFKLLVMSRLSAQCTDARVNIVSIPLFEKYPDALSMSQAENEDIEKLIFSCGLYKTKARDIKKMSIQLMENFGGEVPDNMTDLLSLSGVGRKIANLIMGDVFGKGGIVADTHCIRISNRLGLTDSKNPVIVEKQLDKLIPKEKQTDFCHRIVHFGRDICSSQGPKCEKCFFCEICPFFHENKTV